MLPSKITSLVYLPRAKGNGGQGAWEAGLGSRGMEGRRGGTAARGINHVRTYFMKSETGGFEISSLEISKTDFNAPITRARGKTKRAEHSNSQ